MIHLGFLVLYVAFLIGSVVVAVGIIARLVEWRHRRRHARRRPGFVIPAAEPRARAGDRWSDFGDRPAGGGPYER